MRYRFVPDPSGDPRLYRLQPVLPKAEPEAIAWEPIQLARLRFLKWRIEAGHLKTVPLEERRSGPGAP